LYSVTLSSWTGNYETRSICHLIFKLSLPGGMAEVEELCVFRPTSRFFNVRLTMRRTQNLLKRGDHDDHAEREPIMGVWGGEGQRPWWGKPKACCPFSHNKGPKIRDSNENSPLCQWQTASRSRDQPQVLVNGRAPGPPIPGPATEVNRSTRVRHSAPLTSKLIYRLLK